jgi:hemoglobin
MKTSMEQTMYEVAGGEAGLYSLASAFYRRIFADPLMLPLFAHPDDDHVGRMALFLGEYLGGPAEHTRQRGGDETMARIHMGLHISNKQRERWLEHMRAAFEEVQIPAEFVEHFEPKMQYLANLAQNDSWS